MWGVGMKGGEEAMGTRHVSANGPEGSDSGRGFFLFLFFSNAGRNVSVRASERALADETAVFQRCLQKEETSFGIRRERTDSTRAREVLMAALLTKRS